MSPQEQSEIAAFLSRHSPEEINSAAVSRARSHGVTLEVRYESRFPTGPSGEYLPAYDVAVGCEIMGTTAQREAALADLMKFQVPAPARHIEEWITELSVITAGKSRDGITAELTLTAYSSRLSQYPADVVQYVLRERTWKWFPTWEELEKVCEAKAGPRRHMISALSRPEPDRSPRRRRPTKEERDRVQAMVDEMFPMKPRKEREAAVDLALRGNCMLD
jgi:hypothetical protein